MKYTVTFYGMKKQVVKTMTINATSKENAEMIAGSLSKGLAMEQPAIYAYDVKRDCDAEAYQLGRAINAITWSDIREGA